MTKRDLIRKLAGQIKYLNSKDAEVIVNTIFDSMTEALALCANIDETLPLC